MLQRLGIRGKLLAVVAVPILVLIVAAGVITLGSVQDLNAARSAEQLVDAMDHARDLQRDLQEERAVAAGFVHSVQDGQSKLRTARGLTETGLDDLAERLSEPDIENAQEIQDAVDAALSRSGDEILAAERSLEITSPTDESGGWVVFPSDEEITAMQDAYQKVVARIDNIIEGLPGDSNLNVSLAALSFRVNSESELATELFTVPLEYQPALDEVAQTVDRRVQTLDNAVESLSDSEETEQAAASLRAAQAATTELNDIRDNVRSVRTGPATVTTFYTNIIETIVESSSDVAVAMTNRDLVSVVQAYGDLDALVENIKYEAVVIDRLIRAGIFLPGEASQVRTFTTVTDLSLGDAQRSSASTGILSEVPNFGASASGSVLDANSFESVRTQVLTGLDSSLFSARTGDWDTQVDEELQAYEPLRDQAWQTVKTRASGAAQSALVQTIITAVAVAAVVVISIVVALIIARTIIGPLRRLTTAATAVREELPRLVARVAIPGEAVDVTEVQIPVESRDEVGRLAEAFNGVNAATLVIAGEQAALRGSISEMFVNVARRDQVLLNRQLASIDEMERTEDNPETLTKLFALDHLATRMRRNSESLLVLAGIDTGRRLRRPMPLSDVIRTASSEIELYERVKLELDVDPQMLGHSALTTAHLIAELLENATVFSDPGSPVVVRTAQQGDAYVVEVEDNGIGMTPKELEAANNRIASTSASEILGAQRLGLFVVGRIARRVGAQVTLASTEGEGTVARVAIPKSVFAQGTDTPGSLTQASTVDQATHAPAALARHNVADEVIDAPAAMPRGVGAYTPTAIGGGSDLTGRAGRGEPASSERSIEDLIASDAASAPVAQPADPSALTDGSTPAGLPTRRRRETSAPADAGAGQSSIVGLPARATDAQLSALAAEGATGFKPAVPASEVAPQTAEERASMFRGFRARGGAAEPAAPSASDPSSQEQAQDWGVPVDTAGAPALPVRRPSPVSAPAPAEPVPPRDSTSTRGAGMAAAGAAGAAAFFARRAREEGTSFTDQQERSLPTAPEIAVPQLSPDETGGGQDPRGAASASPVADAPATHRADTDQPASAPEPPVFRIPVVEPESAPHSAATPEADDAAFVVPGFADEDSQPQANAAPAEPVRPETPYGGVEQVMLDTDAPAVEPEPVHGFLNANPYADSQQPQRPQVDEPSFEPSPSYVQEEQFPPAGDYQEPQPEAAQPYEQSAFTPVAQPAAQPDAVPPTRQGAPARLDERSNANLDALLQTVADNETQQRPGFFSRLFGRGRHADADAASIAATEWADVDGDQSAPAPASDSPMTFMPVSDAAPAAAPRQSMFTAEPAPVQQPASAPTAAPTEGSWDTNAQGFDPAPVTQASAPEMPAAPAWQSAPAAPEPEPATFQPAPTWEPAERADVAQPQEFSPVSQPEPAGPGGMYTPDQLADATGWQAAGASALQAAQPDVATSYQPIIQPDESDQGDADLTSAVFSEFSSLASERPKVEKTRAGLERRRPRNAKPVEVKPIADTPDIVPKERDADAIRNRFNSFYSGTQRARDDVAVFDNQPHSSEVSET